MEQLKDKLVSSFMVMENELDNPDWAPVFDIRQKAMDHFEAKGFPTKKDEEWKYTNLKPILKFDYKLIPNRDNETIEFKDVKRFFLHDIDTYIDTSRKAVAIRDPPDQRPASHTHTHTHARIIPHERTQQRDRRR
mgnify:CR=1 FL=1